MDNLSLLILQSQPTRRSRRASPKCPFFICENKALSRGPKSRRKEKQVSPCRINTVTILAGERAVSESLIRPLDKQKGSSGEDRGTRGDRGRDKRRLNGSCGVAKDIRSRLEIKQKGGWQVQQSSDGIELADSEFADYGPENLLTTTDKGGHIVWMRAHLVSLRSHFGSGGVAAKRVLMLIWIYLMSFIYQIFKYGALQPTLAAR